MTNKELKRKYKIATEFIANVAYWADSDAEITQSRLYDANKALALANEEVSIANLALTIATANSNKALKAASKAATKVNDLEQDCKFEESRHKDADAAWESFNKDHFDKAMQE